MIFIRSNNHRLSVSVTKHWTLTRLQLHIFQNDVRSCLVRRCQRTTSPFYLTGAITSSVLCFALIAGGRKSTLCSSGAKIRGLCISLSNQAGDGKQILAHSGIFIWKSWGVPDAALIALHNYILRVIKQTVFHAK